MEANHSQILLIDVKFSPQYFLKLIGNVVRKNVKKKTKKIGIR